MVLLMIYHHLRLRLLVSTDNQHGSYLPIIMDMICPHCDKDTFSDKYALKRHAERCEITSSTAPARKSSRKTKKPDPILLNKDSDLEKALSSSCPFDQ